MASGLFALLDDVATFARLAATSVDDVGAAAGKTVVKTAGVVIDDTAVTPQYVQGISAERELPVVKRIAWGSLRNKLLLILPAVMLLSQFAPWAVTPILMLGATYLCFEGAEKVWHYFTGHHEHGDVNTGGSAGIEDRTVRSAVRTDLILSTEIMVISLNEVMNYSFQMRLAVLVVVALLMTVAVYGVVGLIVRMDDMGLSLAQRGSKTSQRVGRSLVNAMPKVLTALTVIGTVAMLWVGGHIFLAGTNTLGWHVLYASVHHAAEWVSGFAGGFGDWFAETALSAVFGLLWGTIVFKTVDGVEWVHGKVTRKKLKSIGTSMMTGIAEDVETPIIRSGEPFMTEDVEDGFAR